MKAIQWHNNLLELKEVPLPERSANEALLKVRKAGICNTDLEILRAYGSFEGTLGHEFIGTVQEADDKKLIAKRVVSDINCACHHCEMCHSGNPHHCLNRHTIGINKKDGAFAEFLTVPVANLILVPDNLEDNIAVFAEPVAAALEIQEQIDFSTVAEVLVIGDGKLGLLIAMCLASTGSNVSLLGHHPEKQELLSGFNVQFMGKVPDIKFPVVIEATGNPAGFHDAIGLTAAKGTLVLKSTYADGFQFNPTPVVIKEITLLGSRCGPMQKAIDLLASDKIKPQGLIEAEFPLDDGVSAIEFAGRKGILKVLLTMS